ncbi:MAG: DNA gyrase inhibitor YacG [Acidobacteria bacterium]|nr:DNA gyrase inhibitor YacG [Acidobacteriota bacterium]
MNCPICKKPAPEQEQYYPFCSERCRVIDLGRWASGEYVVSTPLRSDSEKITPQSEEGEGPPRDNAE